MSPDDPRRQLYVRWHPCFAFGQPTLGNSAIEAESVGGLVWAGDSVQGLAEDYGITVDQVRLACWWWRRHHLHVIDTTDFGRLKAWDRWADRFLSWAGGHTDDNPGNPPEATP